MRIIELKANNFARLHAVEIRPDGAIVPIVGKNAQGKSSVLRAIWSALEGKAAAPARAIRDGATEARLEVQIGTDKVELAILRTIKRRDDGVESWDLKVTQADKGRVTRKPQELIDGCLDALAFDPLAFARAKPVDQVAQLRAMVKGFDFERAERLRAAAFDQRTDQNRIAKQERARAQGVMLPPGPEPAAVDVADLTRQLQQAHAHNNRVAEAEIGRERMQSTADQRRAAAAELREDAERMIEKAQAYETEAADLEERVTLVQIKPPRINTAPIVDKIEAADQVNQTRQAFTRRRAFNEAADAAEQRSAELTDVIAKSDAEVRAAIEAAKLPAGLTMIPEGVLLRGVPFEQAGTAEKILASAEVRMALSPDLRVMLIDEGSELDATMLGLLEELAERRDYQVWLARVDEGGAPGFTIEDGRVAAHQKGKPQ